MLDTFVVDVLGVNKGLKMHLEILYTTVNLHMLLLFYISDARVKDFERV